MRDDEVMTGENAFRQVRFIEDKTIVGFGQVGVSAGGDGQNELQPATTLVRQITLNSLMLFRLRNPQSATQG